MRGINPLFCFKGVTLFALVFLAKSFIHNSYAQDIHFSMYRFSPLNLTAATTGNFNGDYRIAANQRRQWRAVTANPYQSISFSAEQKQIKESPVSAGLLIVNDRAGDGSLNNLSVFASASYLIPFSENSRHQLLLGAQPGINQRSIDFSKLSFNNQWDGFGFDPSINPNESFANENQLNFHLNGGALWKFKLSNRTQLESGVNLFNITSPSQNYFGNPDVRIPRRITIFTLIERQLSYDWDILPSFLYMRQGTFNEFITGAHLRYKLDKRVYNYRALYVGAYGRIGDAAVLSVGMDYNKWFFGMSYDLNLSPLKVASNVRGGFEFALIMLFDKNPLKRINFINCKDFI